MFSSLPFGFMFIFTMIFGTLFSVSSSHWLGIWAGLEVNLIGFLPLLVYQKSMSESESAVKYFVVQSLGSALLIFGSLLSFGLSFSWDMIVSSNLSISILILVISGLIVKMGMFPFHFWLPSVMAGLPWISCLILATWQKIAPLFLMSSLYEMNTLYYFMFLFCVLASMSSVMGGLGGINQTQVRAILAYSSIGHLGWIVFALFHSSWAMKTYLFIYILISVCIFMCLWASNLNSVKHFNNMKFTSYSSSIVMLMLLSLGGLPPLLGFISKWMVIFSSMSSDYKLILLFLIIGSLLSLFYYLTLYFSIFMGSNKSLQLNLFNSMSSSMMINSMVLVNLVGGTILILITMFIEA